MSRRHMSRSKHISEKDDLMNDMDDGLRKYLASLDKSKQEQKKDAQEKYEPMSDGELVDSDLEDFRKYKRTAEEAAPAAGSLQFDDFNKLLDEMGTTDSVEPSIFSMPELPLETTDSVQLPAPRKSSKKEKPSSSSSSSSRGRTRAPHNAGKTNRLLAPPPASASTSTRKRSRSHYRSGSVSDSESEHPRPRSRRRDDASTSNAGTGKESGGASSTRLSKAGYEIVNGRYKCPTCSSTFQHEYHVAPHQRTTKSCQILANKAPVDGSVNSTSESSVRHSRDKYAKNKDGKYLCPSCDLLFEDSRQVFKHIATEDCKIRTRVKYPDGTPVPKIYGTKDSNGKWPCPVCGTGFDDWRDIIGHMATTNACKFPSNGPTEVYEKTKDGRYKCPKCHFTGRVPSDITRHKGNKSCTDRAGIFFCEESGCDFDTHDLTQYNSHLSKEHGRPPTSQCKCPKCGRILSRAQDLKRHMKRTHKNGKEENADYSEDELQKVKPRHKSPERREKDKKRASNLPKVTAPEGKDGKIKKKK